ncbi:MAG: hypothetical protein ACO3JL_19520, partial [Myxococcota bacterium]
GWLASRPLGPGAHELAVTADAHDVTVEVWNRGPLIIPLAEDRSLVWTESALLDDPTAVGLGRVLGTLAADGHGGALFAAWLTRFSTTAHSERAGPAVLLEELRAAHGDDERQWDLDTLPFIATAVHNRLDLRNDRSCGELRISFASLHPVWRPLHLLFLFRQPPYDDDISPGGTVHCHGTARRWARLSTLEGDAFLAAARQWLEDGLTEERFLLAESEELTVSPWEWRQWVLVEHTTDAELPLRFENPALFQTVDVARVNAPGPLRQAFLSFVEQNAAVLDERRALLPEEFRPLSVRVNAGVPWIPLDLAGVDAEVLASFPKLRQHIEAVGCSGCHSTGEFVQTREDRSFSAFYEGELLARRAHLDTLQHGALPGLPAFGPLQPNPPLTP